MNWYMKHKELFKNDKFPINNRYNYGEWFGRDEALLKWAEEISERNPSPANQTKTTEKEKPNGIVW